MALLTLGLSPYEVRILTILRAQLKSCKGSPYWFCSKKELALFLSSQAGNWGDSLPQWLKRSLGTSKNVAENNKSPVKNVFAVFLTEKDLPWCIKFFRNSIKVGTHLTTCRCNMSRRQITPCVQIGWQVAWHLITTNRFGVHWTTWSSLCALLRRQNYVAETRQGHPTTVFCNICSEKQNNA